MRPGDETALAALTEHLHAAEWHALHPNRPQPPIEQVGIAKFYAMATHLRPLVSLSNRALDTDLMHQITDTEGRPWEIAHFAVRALGESYDKENRTLTIVETHRGRRHVKHYISAGVR